MQLLRTGPLLLLMCGVRVLLCFVVMGRSELVECVDGSRVGLYRVLPERLVAVFEASELSQCRSLRFCHVSGFLLGLESEEECYCFSRDGVVLGAFIAVEIRCRCKITANSNSI